MSTKTGIEWTERTWNPIAGCNDVSEGCRNCYARTMAKRLAAMGVAKYAGLTVLQGSKTVWTGKIAFDEKALLAPLKRKKPTTYFVNSMSDLFHENVTDEMLDRIFAVMVLCPQHTFQVLTKRPDRMLAYLTPTPSNYQPANIFDEADDLISDFVDRNIVWPFNNVQLGVSVEDQKTADARIPLLLQTPASKRFLSAEPLLGYVDLRGEEPACFGSYLDWVIVGGESGPGARPMHPDWARSVRDQCVAAGVPFFFKQWGEWHPAWGSATHILSLDAELIAASHEDPRAWKLKTHEAIERIGKKAAGRLLDGREWNEMPEVPQCLY